MIRREFSRCGINSKLLITDLLQKFHKKAATYAYQSAFVLGTT